MSCEQCEIESDNLQKIAYYRWKNANIGLIGCDEHLKEVIEALNEFRNLTTKGEGR